MRKDTTVTTATSMIDMELSPSPPPPSPPALLTHSSGELEIGSSASSASTESFCEQEFHSPITSTSSDDLGVSLASPDICRQNNLAIISDQAEASAPLLREDVESSLSLNSGYKIVFDNIDKNVKPRYMRSDSQIKSLHYVQSYAVRNRIDFSFQTSHLRRLVHLTFLQVKMTTDCSVLISRLNCQIHALLHQRLRVKPAI